MPSCQPTSLPQNAQHSLMRLFEQVSHAHPTHADPAKRATRQGPSDPPLTRRGELAASGKRESFDTR